MMKTTYRGHEIEIHREQCPAGYALVYYSIFRLADGFECASGFTSAEDSLAYLMQCFKDRVDKELYSADPWGESADTAELLGARP